MRTILAGILIAAAYMWLFYIWGKAFLIFNRSVYSMSKSILFGFLAMVSVFQFFYLPFFLLRGSFKTLASIWLAFIALTTPRLFFYNRKHSVKQNSEHISIGKIICFTVAIGLNIFLCIQVAYHPRPYGADTNYYISVMNDMVYHDIICIDSNGLDMHHGLTNIFAFFGVAAWLTGVRPFYLELHTMRYIVVLLTAITAYYGGETLFHDKHRISWPGIGMAIIIPVLFSFWDSMYGGAFFWQRANEAKAICQLVLFPIALVGMLQFFENSINTKTIWHEQLLIGFAAVPITISSLSIYPVFLLIIIFAIAAYRRMRGIKELVRYGILCVMPNLVYFAIYITSKYWIAF